MLDDAPAADVLTRARGFGAPSFRLGPFLVGPDGSLCPSEGASQPGLRVRWRDRTVRACIDGGAAGGQGALMLEAVIGRVPSTAAAGAAEPHGREQAFGLLHALPAHVPESWQVRLLPDHQIGLAAPQALPMPALAADLLAGVTAFLPRLDPYLEVLDAADAGLSGRAAAFGADGTAKIWPG